MINNFIDNVNLGDSTSSKHLFRSLDRHKEDYSGIELRHSVHYNVQYYPDLFMKYKDSFSIAITIITDQMSNYNIVSRGGLIICVH